MILYTASIEINKYDIVTFVIHRLLIKPSNDFLDQSNNFFVKLKLIFDLKYLSSNSIRTLKALKVLVEK
jgi:hypothetical protein